MRFWRGKAFHLVLLLSSFLLSSCTEIDDLKKAAEQGDADAQFNLGYMYYKGNGVVEDDVMAYLWWNLAAAQGFESAKKNKGILSERMTREQIAEAQKLSREWLAKR